MVIDCYNSVYDRWKALLNGHHDRQYNNDFLLFCNFF